MKVSSVAPASGPWRAQTRASAGQLVQVICMSDAQFPWMDEEVELFADTVRRFMQKELVPREKEWAKQGFAERDIWRRCGEVGLLCPSIPVEYGGSGASFAYDAALALEAARNMVVAINFNIHSGIVAHYINAYGSDAQKRRWLPRMASGELIGAIAMSEPSAGSDLKSVRTTARRSGDSYVISGAKTFITHGYVADLIVLVARTGPGEGSRGISLIVVETENLAGFKRGRLLEKIGLKGQDTAELFFEDVEVPADNLLGPNEGQGFIQLMNQLPKERLIIALGALGTMDRALAETLAYAKERKVFGQSLIELQNTRFRLAECKTKLEVARAFVNQCMAAMLEGRLAVPTAAMVKYWCSEANFEVVDECVQLHGGYGYMLEQPIARMFVNARVTRIYGGSNEIMKEVIARSL